MKSDIARPDPITDPKEKAPQVSLVRLCLRGLDFLPALCVQRLILLIAQLAGTVIINVLLADVLAGANLDVFA